MWRLIAGVLALVLGGVTFAATTTPSALAAQPQALSTKVTCLGVEGYQVDWFSPICAIVSYR